MPGFPDQLPELAQTHPGSWWCHLTISSSVSPFSSWLQSFPSSGSFPVSGFFASGGRSIRASLQSFQWGFRTDFFYHWLVKSKGLLRVFSNTTTQHHNSSALSLLYGPNLTSIHDYQKNHSFAFIREMQIKTTIRYHLTPLRMEVRK